MNLKQGRLHRSVEIPISATDKTQSHFRMDMDITWDNRLKHKSVMTFLESIASQILKL